MHWPHKWHLDARQLDWLLKGTLLTIGIVAAYFDLCRMLVAVDQHCDNMVVIMVALSLVV